MDLKGKRVLVTGGCGQIGSTLIDLLVQDDGPEHVIVLDDMSRGTMENLALAQSTGKVTLVTVDISDAAAIRPYFDGIDAVFHQAAIRITRCAEDTRACLDVLIGGTFNVLTACVEAGVQKIIAASSASVYGMADDIPTSEIHHPYNNRTWYGAAKLTGEAMLRSFNEMYGLDYVALRYFNVYGPRMDVFGRYTEVLVRWLDCLDKGEQPLIFGDGLQTMDFVFNEDVARANLLAMQSDRSDEVYNVGTGVETSLAELLTTLLQVTGNEGVQPEYRPPRIVNSVVRRCADTTRAREDLGFETQVSLAEGLQRLVAWRQDRLTST